MEKGEQVQNWVEVLAARALASACPCEATRAHTSSVLARTSNSHKNGKKAKEGQNFLQTEAQQQNSEGERKVRQLPWAYWADESAPSRRGACNSGEVRAGAIMELGGEEERMCTHREKCMVQHADME
ncbi:hypothetical protein P7K49_019015, partial [Saguinus oedipus]